MKRPGTRLRRLPLTILTPLSWVGFGGIARADVPVAELSTPFIISYSVVVLLIAAGLFVVCMGTGRKDRAKPQKFDGGAGKLIADALAAGGDDKKKPKVKSLYNRAPELCQDAKTSLTVAALGFVPLIGLALGPIGIMMGTKAKKKVDADRRLTGAGYAQAAMIVGGVAILANIIFLAVVALSLM